jgi:hypothetical protein
MATSPDVTDRVMSWARVDLSPPHRPPAWWRVALATVLAIAGSLAADAALVAIGTRLFPATKGYGHFQFDDYARLTVIGVLIACAAWPIMARVTSAPRWIFFRLAIAVTLVLFLPDLYIWHQGQSAQAVAVLMSMHVAIALITYNLLVHLAPVRARLGRRAARVAGSEASAVPEAPLPGSEGVDLDQDVLPRAPLASGDVGGDLFGPGRSRDDRDDRMT